MATWGVSAAGSPAISTRPSTPKVAPVTLRLTAGQVAERTEALIDGLGEGDILLADKGYDRNAIRTKTAERKVWANIPPKATRKGSLAVSRRVYR